MYNRTVLFLSVSILSLIQATAALAARPNATSRGAKEKAAQKACLTGDVKAGAELLADLYIRTGDPVYLFNQGRCNEQNHRWQEALDMFREYLRKDHDAPERIKAETKAHIAQCQALLAEQNVSPGPPAKTSAVPEPPLVVPPVPHTPTIAPSTTVGLATSASLPSDGRGFRVAGVLTAAVGICAVGVGITLNIKERSLTDQINAKFSQSKESSRASYQAWGYASYGIGAAALVTGATLYYFGWRAGEYRAARTQITLIPTLAPDTVTFGLHGRF